MKKENWKEIERIYEVALNLKIQQQMQFVESESNGDEEIINKVMKMLEASKSQDFMGEYPGKINAENIDVSIPLQLGHFKILKKIATGGMGRVYLGQSTTSDVQIKVALKTIRIELISPELKAKFQNEKNILSQLKHKNIASLIDAGISDNQVPYIATEWVNGFNIKTYCVQHKLPIKKRLKLFLQICDAMKFAHNKLIIHRDLKPDNILVNDQKQVKLLDFGIAKIIDENQATQTQTQIFTPDYAAPEQLNGQMCSAATDIYSLGIILFEILTNSKRFNLSGLAIAEKIQAIAIPKQADLSDVQPDKPLPYSLNQIKGALHNIINKAMHVDPNRRYDSVSSLVADIESYLDNRPVSAMKDSVFYKTKMLLKRNKLASGFLALAFVAIISGWFVSNNQYKLKQREANKSAIMFDFLKTILISGSPIQGGSTKITVKQMFETGIEKYDYQNIKDPYIRAELSAQIGLIYGQIGDMDKEILNTNIALNYYKNNLSNEKNVNSFVKYSSQIVGAYVENHDYEPALTYISNIFDVVDPNKIDHKLLSSLNIYLARIYAAKNNMEKSKLYLNKAWNIVQNTDNYMLIGEVNYYHYALYFDELPDKQALMYLKDAQENFEKALGKQYNPNLQGAISSRADLLSIMGQYKESEILHRKVRKLTLETYGRDDFVGLISRAKNLNKLGKFALSLKLLEEAKQVYDEYKLSRVPAYHGYLSYKAQVFIQLGKYNEAEKMLKTVLGFFTQILPSDHKILKSINTYLAGLYLKSNQVEKRNEIALKLKNYILKDESEKKLPKDVKAAILVNLANIALKEKQFLLAKKYFSAANDLIVDIDKFNQGWFYWQLQTGLELSKIKLGNELQIEPFMQAKKQLLEKVDFDKWYNEFYVIK